MLEDLTRELLDAAREDRIFLLCAEKVEEEPVRELDLEEETDLVARLLLRLKV